jgi:hypothetical protein
MHAYMMLRSFAIFLTIYMNVIAGVRVQQKARRRRVPAFGEWNYNYYGSAELATPAAAVPFERYAATCGSSTRRPRGSHRRSAGRSGGRRRGLTAAAAASAPVL